MLNQNFELYLPTRVIFGAGKSKTSGEVIHSLGGRKVLVVSDPGVIEANLLDEILSSIESTGLDYTVFSDVGHEASLTQVQEGLNVLRAEECDILLSVGGGSVMDTAKGIGCLANNPGNLRDYEGPEKFKNPPLPTVAVPTTAGSGSELSFGAVISDDERNYKFSFRSSIMRVMPSAITLLPYQFLYSFWGNQRFIPDFLLQLHKPTDQSLRTRRTTRYIYIHRNNFIYTFDHMITMLPIRSTAVCTRTHRDHISWLSHLFIQSTHTVCHFKCDCTGNEHYI